MTKFIEVNETTLVAEERMPFYVDNKFTDLFEIGHGINRKIESINSMVDELISSKVDKIDSLETKEEKDQWYAKFLHDLTQINQALYQTTTLLDEKIANQK